LPIDANVSSGLSASPGGSAGFSRKSLIVTPSSAVSITPNAVASRRGTRIPATETPAPDSMCDLTIWEASIRYTWSAPNTTM
jgi:hypothetical protein